MIREPSEKIIEKIKWIGSSQSPDELAARYDSIAQEWDHITRDSFYITPQKTVAKLFKYVLPEAHILDAGCGTGIIGDLLREKGYTYIEGLDLSEGMLQEARRKNQYISLTQQSLGKRLSFPNNYFDAVILSGVFLRGHAPCSSFDDLLRITKLNGYLIFSLCSDLLRFP